MPYVQIKGRILSFEEFEMGPRKKRVVAHFSDGRNVCDLVWFNGTKYVYSQYQVGKEYICFGKPGIFGGRFQFTHPELDEASQVSLSEMGMQPYYMTTEKMKKSGMTSRTIEKMQKTLVLRLAHNAARNAARFHRQTPGTSSVITTPYARYTIPRRPRTRSGHVCG